MTDERLIYLPASGTRLVLWNERQAGEVTPFYAIGQNSEPVGQGKRTSYVLELLHGSFDPAVRIPGRVRRPAREGDRESCGRPGSSGARRPAVGTAPGALPPSSVPGGGEPGGPCGRAI